MVKVVRVHHFKHWDIASGMWRIPSFKVSIEWIIMSGGESIAGTAEEVDPSLLDEQGRYHRKAPATPNPVRTQGREREPT